MKKLKITVSRKNPDTGLNEFMIEGSEISNLYGVTTTVSLAKAKAFLGIEAAEYAANQATLVAGGHWKAALHAYEED